MPPPAEPTRRLPRSSWPLFAAAALLGCQARAEPAVAPAAPSRPAFDAHWRQGKAEITSYELDQARYGEIHRGHAVLVFVTEPFSRTKQVKLDRPGSVPGDAVDVLKLNFTKKFSTGVYPYSIMQSVFTPVDRQQHPRSLKTTMSVQEWCGHVFAQLNMDGDGWRVRSFSYFESEGDDDGRLELAQLEDELWNLVRLDPSALPIGEVRLIPGIEHSRLRHRPLEVESATATLAAGSHGGTPVLTYSLSYPRLERSLSIHFEPEFPHGIVGWEERRPSGFGRGAKALTTRATRKKTLMLDYWNQHDVEDAVWRQRLGLD